jgi:hypothetical protein
MTFGKCPYDTPLIIKEKYGAANHNSPIFL